MVIHLVTNVPGHKLYKMAVLILRFSTHSPISTIVVHSIHISFCTDSKSVDVSYGQCYKPMFTCRLYMNIGCF